MHHHITGLPVVDEEQRVVGVVSDYDLLSLDAVSGKMQARPPSSHQTRKGRPLSSDWELSTLKRSLGWLPNVVAEFFTRQLGWSSLTKHNRVGRLAWSALIEPELRISARGDLSPCTPQACRGCKAAKNYEFVFTSESYVL